MVRAHEERPARGGGAGGRGTDAHRSWLSAPAFGGPGGPDPSARWPWGAPGASRAIAMRTEVTTATRSQCVPCSSVTGSRGPLALPGPPAASAPMAGCLDAAFPDLLSGSREAPARGR